MFGDYIMSQKPDNEEKIQNPSESKIDDTVKDKNGQKKNGDTPKKEEKKEMVEIEKEEYEKLLRAKEIADEEIKRARADALNFRKRVEKEKSSFLEFATGNVLARLLPVSDDLKRLIENGKDDIPESHYNAILSLEQRINEIYSAEGVSLIKITKKKTAFDPHKHHAVFALPTDEYPANVVIDVTSSGFIKGDRVLRPASVVISKPTETPETEKKDSSPIESKEKSTDKSSDQSADNSTEKAQKSNKEEN